MEIVRMMDNSDTNANYVGEPCKAKGWYNFTDTLHTVSIHVFNFIGRVYIEQSIVIDPTEDDWFPIKLTDTENFVQFPLNPLEPTGFEMAYGMGDTTCVGFTFRTNAVWLRARMDRDYLSTLYNLSGPETVKLLGNVNKVLLAL